MKCFFINDSGIVNIITFFSRQWVDKSNNSLCNIFLRWLWIKWPSCAISCFSCVHKIKLMISRVLRGSKLCRIGVPFFSPMFNNSYPTWSFFGQMKLGLSGLGLGSSQSVSWWLERCQFTSWALARRACARHRTPHCLGHQITGQPP